MQHVPRCRQDRSDTSATIDPATVWQMLKRLSLCFESTEFKSKRCWAPQAQDCCFDFSLSRSFSECHVPPEGQCPSPPLTFTYGNVNTKSGSLNCPITCSRPLFDGSAQFVCPVPSHMNTNFAIVSYADCHKAKLLCSWPVLAAHVRLPLALKTDTDTKDDG